MKVSYGQTEFELQGTIGQGSRVLIRNAEGSAMSVPTEDLLRFVAFAYVVPMKAELDGQKDYQEILTGHKKR